MELRQLRYFVRVLELGSISRAALDLALVQSALSQQISRLESELSTRLLQRTSKGVVMALFVTLPYGKFAHGIFRTAALLKWAIEKRQPNRLQLGSD